MAKKYKNVMQDFLAIVTERGKKVVLDEQIVKKYNLRAGLLSPFSSQPIVKTTKKVRVEVAPKRKVRISLKKSKPRAKAKSGTKKKSRRRPTRSRR